MTNAELIATLRGENYFVTLLHDAADALEAADKRIEQLEKQEPTEKQVVDYCRKRCLVIVEEELFHRMKSTFSQLPKEGEWIMLDPKNFIEMCSRCRYTAYTVNRPHYCPNCGAKMKGANDEQIH